MLKNKNKKVHTPHIYQSFTIIREQQLTVIKLTTNKRSKSVRVWKKRKEAKPVNRAEGEGEGRCEPKQTSASPEKIV